MKRALSNFENATTVIAFAIVVVIAFANVVSRYVLGISFAFTSELTINLSVYVAIVGSVIALRENAHLGFSLLVDRSQGLRKKALEIFVGVAITAFYLLITIYSAELALEQAQRGTVTPALGIPNYWYTSALVLGGILGTVRAVEIVVGRMKKPAAELVVRGESWSN